jgi:hypothetical protein
VTTTHPEGGHHARHEQLHDVLGCANRGLGGRCVAARRRVAGVSYIDWRADAGTVSAAYTRWSDARADDEPALFAAYLAALDQEESAASEYELLMQEFDLLVA